MPEENNQAKMINYFICTTEWGSTVLNVASEYSASQCEVLTQHRITDLESAYGNIEQVHVVAEQGCVLWEAWFADRYLQQRAPKYLFGMTEKCVCPTQFISNLTFCNIGPS